MRSYKKIKKSIVEIIKGFKFKEGMRTPENQKLKVWCTKCDKRMENNGIAFRSQKPNFHLSHSFYFLEEKI